MQQSSILLRLDNFDVTFGRQAYFSFIPNDRTIYERKKKGKKKERTSISIFASAISYHMSAAAIAIIKLISFRHFLTII